MKYQLHLDHHTDFSTISIGEMKPRAYAIPFAGLEEVKKTTYITERKSSSMVQVLSGDWDFKFYPTVLKMKDKIDTDKMNFDTIHVPSTWQRTGYQNPVYLNCPYEFKTFEPFVPTDMPAAIYRKKFRIDDMSGHFLLSFLGVATCADVYVNGSFVGYREGTHNSSDFEITSLLKEGENELLVVVFKWCNGSFLESQDMFRENGIFRDVLLYHYGDTYLYDYKIDADRSANGHHLHVEASLAGKTEGVQLRALLCDGEKTLAEGLFENGEIDFPNLSVEEWNAELPRLYTLYLSLLDGGKEIMCVRNAVGFKEIRIDGQKFYFNDKLIKIKGVNHHDSSLYNGYAMTAEELIQDVEMMKAYNVNAVRTSHYPPDPFFLQLCDAYGLYCVDEADIETHGCAEMARDVDYISSQKKWIPHYVDRVKHMVYRDRNRACILMWSLGNEAGGYTCQDACYDFIKSIDKKIPVHYEGVIRTKRFCYDVISNMYNSTEDLELIGKGTKRDGANTKFYRSKPYFYCEYAHAMGQGPGCLEEYWQLFYRYDNLMGGCIWEWSDHTVYHDGTDGYRFQYTYGGDHGERQHDGNFCVDGLVYADRRPHTGALEMRNVYRPLRASLTKEKKLAFLNTNRFRNSDYLRVEWTLTRDGEILETGKLSLDIAPEATTLVDLPCKSKLDTGKDLRLLFSYYDGELCLAEDQVIISDQPMEFTVPIGEKISVFRKKNCITAEFDGGQMVFDAKTGFPISYKVNGKEFLAQEKTDKPAFSPNLYRTMIDNDMARRRELKCAGLWHLEIDLLSFDIKIQEESILFIIKHNLSDDKVKLYETETKYELSASGVLHFSCAMSSYCVAAYVDLPRFGVLWELPAGFENVDYIGFGPYENAPDFEAQCHFGHFQTTVADLFEHYVYPQDNGNHGHTKMLRLTDASKKGFTLYADSEFSFAARHCTQDALDAAKHDEEIAWKENTILSLDGFLRGVGTLSCGPDTREEYRLHLDKKLPSVAFTIVPDLE